MKYLLTGFAAVLLTVAQPVFATSQEPDRLVLEGEQLNLETNPLSPLIQAGHITLPEPVERWSSNWRGYVATWTVSNNQLLLSKLEVLLQRVGADEKADPALVNVLSQVFPGHTQVPAEWFSGTLIVPRGEVVEYVHMGYGSTHERYTVLGVENGRIVARNDLSAKEFTDLRAERFADYQRTPEYALRFKEVSNEVSASAAERFLYEFSVEEYMSVAP